MFYVEVFNSDSDGRLDNISASLPTFEAVMAFVSLRQYFTMEFNGQRIARLLIGLKEYKEDFRSSDVLCQWKKVNDLRYVELMAYVPFK